jgi:NAD(P)-dependent dehydrogenase (short-subunit alcohol dehydrogenase family)
MTDGVLDRFRMTGRVAIVTGSARGLGRAMASALASAGATVVASSRDRATAEAAAEEISQRWGARALGIELDVTRADSIEAMVERTVTSFGRLDILVNNAGTTERGPLGALTEAQWDRVVDTNLRGAWMCCRAALPAMRASGAGRMINVSSMFSQVGLPDRTPYIASKGGLTALTRALAVELASDRITVNAICPGPFQTDMHHPSARADMLAAIPLGRWGQPDELGPVAVFLASDAASFITGTTLTIDGGYTTR